MSRQGFKSAVYHGETFLGELDAVPVTGRCFQFPNNEIRIHHISPVSERCPPLSVLQTISPFSVCCKLESSSPVEQSHLINLHASCFYELKTAVVVLGDEEIHLVAMPSKQKKFPCFWCYSIPSGLYNSSLALLNLRCLAIVFDLDETLIVANTMKSFEDRIETLRGWVARETDPVRISGMSGELKRYVDDRALLKQYAENDYVIDNGRMFKVQMEEILPLSDSHEKIVRPVIRLQDKGIVLTRINPEIRDTSVLVRLRPAWEDLRSYLTAKGRKRFEVYVCTMAERDYALEMWRLLDPEAHLISSRQLLDRVVCVKSGSRKSLLNVFQNGTCHPKMAMVIDDRSKVWEDRDQPQVHVVPPFTPYYAPQAETANVVPVLCVARNVACNVRGYFFKEFDENLLRKISEVFFEDDVVNLPGAPDVSNYLVFEDTSQTNGTANAPIMEGMHGAEVDRRLNQVVADALTNGSESRPETSQPTAPVNPPAAGPATRTLLPSEKPSLLGIPARQDINFPDKDQELKNVKLGVDLRNASEPPLLSRPPILVPPVTTPRQGVAMVEEDANKANNQPTVLPQDSDVSKFDRPRINQNPFCHSISSFNSSRPPSTATQMKTEEASAGHDLQKPNISSRSQPSVICASQNNVYSSDKEAQIEGGRVNVIASSMSINALQEIGRRCSSKVEFRSVLSTSKDMQFSFEVLFSGEKIGFGMGKTRKDAQQQAALDALHSLAEKYVKYATATCSGTLDGNADKLSLRNGNGFLWDVVDSESRELSGEDGMGGESIPLGGESHATSTN